MILPWLTLQTAYAHFAWAIVLATSGVGLLALKRPLSIPWSVGWVVLVFTLCALPGSASPSYWLNLAFHLPSPLFVACSTMAVWAHAQGRVGYRVMSHGLAVCLVIAGAVLYADTAGSLYLGLYVRGFGPEAAFAGLLVAAAALMAITAGKRLGAPLAIVMSLMFFSLTRLPTGNVWDAVLDPLLWLWAIFSLVARGLAWHRGTRVAASAP
jgi:hypothetical protein